MTTFIPHDICPGSILTDPQRAAAELMKAFIVRSNFIPGVRHGLGWRGIRDCLHDLEGWTAKIHGRPGVYGIRFQGTRRRDHAVEGLFPISYFPHPEEEAVEHFSVQAGILTQQNDYWGQVREYLRHASLRELFTIGRVRLAVQPDASGFCLELESPSRLITIADNGVSVQRDGETIQAVEPGKTDTDLPCWDIALDLFRTLSASAAFCVGNAPDILAEHLRPGQIYHYASSGETSLETDLHNSERCLGLGFRRHPLGPDGRDTYQPWPSEPHLSWREGQDLPEKYENEPWWRTTPTGQRNSLDKDTLGITDKPRLIVLSGFLGSGKTSFLRHFIEHQAARNQFVAVVQNEIGETGLDAKLLDQSYAVLEVDEGCVCCSLIGSLKGAVLEIMKSFHPDDIVVETTGLANPSNLLAEIAEIEDVVAFDSVITMVDAQAGRDCLSLYEVARSQAATADVLIINKTDLVDPEELDRLRQTIRTFNPFAPLVETQQGDVHPALLEGLSTRKPKGAGLTLTDLRNHTHDHMSSVSLPVRTEYDRKQFEQDLAELPTNIFRLKGVVRFAGEASPSIIQWVNGQGTITPASPDVGEIPPFLIAIGKKMEHVNTAVLFEE